MRNVPDFSTTEPLALPTSAYRDAKEGAEKYKDKLLLLRWKEFHALPAEVKRIYQKRFARIVASSVAIFGAVVFALTTFFYWDWQNFSGSTSQGELSILLLSSSVLTLLVYLFVAHRSKLSLQNAFARTFQTSENTFSAIDRLENLSPKTFVQTFLKRLEQKSIVLPMIAISIFFPLTLLLLVHTFFPIGQPIEMVRIDSKLSVELILSLHCHLLLVYFCWFFVKKLSKMPTESIKKLSNKDGWIAFVNVLLAIFISYFSIIFEKTLYTIKSNIVHEEHIFAFMMFVFIFIAFIFSIMLFFIPFLFYLVKKNLLQERMIIEMTP